MEIIIYQDFLTEISRAIDAIRPELLAAHTDRYHTKIPFPFNVNDAADPNKLPVLKAEVDYDVRASGMGFNIQSGQMDISVSANVASARSDAKTTNEAGFSLAFLLTSFFGDEIKKVYPLVVNRAQLIGVQPVGLAETVGWFVAEAISKATENQGMPAEFEVVKGKITLLVQKPELKPGQIQLKAKIK